MPVLEAAPGEDADELLDGAPSAPGAAASARAALLPHARPAASASRSALGRPATTRPGPARGRGARPPRRKWRSGPAPQTRRGRPAVNLCVLGARGDDARVLEDSEVPADSVLSRGSPTRRPSSLASSAPTASPSAETSSARRGRRERGQGWSGLSWPATRWC